MKKTPREILFERHRAAQAKLDAIREGVLDERFRTATTSAALRQAEPVSWPMRLWLELFWPARRTWGTLAGAWIVIFFLHLTSSEPAAPVTVAAKKSSAEILNAFKEQQQQQMAELMASGFDDPVESEPFVPRPRSERPATIKLV